jgi:3',5'-cyclic AMP phosphodiesterase CpdA
VRVFAVGDLANQGERDDRVAAMIERHRPDAFLALGDLVYPHASTANFDEFYEPSYGRFDAIVWPTPGNHDYQNGRDTAYLEYMARRAPHVPQQPYYMTQLGTWHLYSLNSEIGQSKPGTAMYDWLKARLEADGARCVAAIWHAPIYTAGRKPYDEDGMRPIYDLLVQHGVDLILVGHDHNYQRWNVEVPYFVVGTGGKSRYALHPNPQLAYGNDQVNGALELDLGADGAEFTYRTMDDQVLDSGSFRCSGRG